ncbi:phosphoglycerate mutase-like protein [Macroventuria anomochaeta]|uniref:Phosphoglycerate mutase-like protein n=1 Tax=Macroventuria anomochaeta TaxID=301207 RepID=A0ACB6S5H7_9PLEO|nr:phosphoglycerate mutase-like protein [Macroventuria anomochaeta]KAF2629511.1 phosphoglycerate mutase-like protein [Macroventuria anomochaeta]
MNAAYSRTLVLLGAVVTLFSLYWGYTSNYPATCPPPDAQHGHTGYFAYECAGRPHHSSWSSWWHPQRNDGSIFERGQGAGATTKDWNILYHLGGNGPWVEKVIDVVATGIAVPDGCEVEQVHMMARHAERYPTKTAGRNQRAVVEKMKRSGIRFTGNLAFFNNWELFWTDDAILEQLTSTGPFSGRLGSFTTGVRLRTRYHHLFEKALARNATSCWASGSKRVIETARHFALGFFGLDAPTTLKVISEKKSRGANTLTPGRTCHANQLDGQEGKAKGYHLMGEFRTTYLPAIAERLSSQTGLTFTPQDIFSMQEMCGFETTVRGRSDWCDVFTQDEFLAFEYARDILHYYRAGPGQKYAAAMGWLWLNATTNLMLEGPAAGPLFFSFVHDGDIAPMITALDVINDEEHLPTSHIQHDRKWRKSQVSPMGGRIIFELLSCRASNEGAEGKYVRVNINDGITALSDCQNGPGNSCPLDAFAARTKKKGEDAGNFVDLCGLEEGAADRITFLHQ